MQELAAEEFRKGGKLTAAIPSGFEAIYYELQMALEVTMLPKGISFVRSIPMNSMSSTYNVLQAETLYQPNDDGKTASYYSSRNHTSQSQQTIPILQSRPRLRYNNAQEVIESNYAARAFRPLPMKRFSVAHRCISIKTYQHSEIVPFPLSFFQKPQR